LQTELACSSTRTLGCTRMTDRHGVKAALDASMTTYLYKVAPPRTERLFYPSPFWHTSDWESSTTRFREGYIKDDVLFAGDFDEVSIHLFPRVRTVRVRSIDADMSTLYDLGVRSTSEKLAYVFTHHSRRKDVESFHPTIFKFHSDGFVCVRKGEYISLRPQEAVSVETISMAEALNRWNVEACYVNDLDAVIERLTRDGIYFDEQT
jgi:hypothetical protein